MTRITNTDKLVMLLQERLKAASRKGKDVKTAKTGKTVAPAKSGDVALARELANAGHDENDTHHALIQGILSQEFGDRLVNDANFQQIVGQVVEIIKRDPEMRKHLQNSLRELGGN